MIRVAFDARSVVPQSSGIGNYAASLLRHMIPHADGFQFTVLRHPGSRQPFVESDRVREVELIPGETKSVATLLRSSAVRRLAGHDLFHSPADMVPPRLPCPFVVTIHDLMWLEAPHLASGFLPSRLAMHLWYRAHYTHSIRRSRAIIAISQATSDAIARLFPEYAHKVRVIRHGLDAQRFDPRKIPDRKVLDGWVPPGFSFVLAVGQGSPYKNHANIVRAFLRATQDRPDLRLLLVRRFARVDGEMRALLSRPEVRRKVIVHPFVPGEVLLALYGHAKMLVFASHYEGCGMPAMEAMALGTPVVGSRAPAVTEMTGDAALHAESTDVADIASKIRMLLEDEALRRRLIEAGRERVGIFSWDQCARDTLDLYRSVL